jgi:hypothetical protein
VRAALLAAIGFFVACSSEVAERAAPATHTPRFADYPTDSLAGPAAPVDLTSSTDAHRFRTALRAGAVRGPNFAGRLTIVTWGCGTQCLSYAIVDARTGRVFSDSALDFSCHVPEYRRGSALVVQRSDTVALGQCSTGPTRYFRWAGDQLVELRADAIQRVAATQAR